MHYTQNYPSISLLGGFWLLAPNPPPPQPPNGRGHYLSTVISQQSSDRYFPVTHIRWTLWGISGHSQTVSGPLFRNWRVMISLLSITVQTWFCLWSKHPLHKCKTVQYLGMQILPSLITSAVDSNQWSPWFSTNHFIVPSASDKVSCKMRVRMEIPQVMCQ